MNIYYDPEVIAVLKKRMLVSMTAMAARYEHQRALARGFWWARGLRDAINPLGTHRLTTKFLFKWTP